MNVTPWAGLLNNAAWLLALFTILEVSRLTEARSRLLKQVINGVLIGAVCIAIMNMPYSLYTGLFFDTRTILLSVTALTVGTVPAVIAGAMGVLARFYAGGTGVTMGVSTILSSVFTGLLWRHLVHGRLIKSRWCSLYVMGLVVHFQMILLFSLAPQPFRAVINRTITGPVLLFFPLVGVALGLLVFYQEDQRRAEAALKESERSKTHLLAHLPGIAYRCAFEPEWTMEFVSQGCLALTGYQPEDLIGNKRISFNELICPEYRDAVWAVWQRSVSQGTPFRYEYRMRTASGQVIWVLEMGHAVRRENGEVEALEGIIVDISDIKAATEQIHYMSEHDDLTDLHNRRFFDRKKKELEAAHSTPVSLLVADINGIRIINDAFGHEAGDRLIVETSRILRRVARKGDVLARTGGDEFAMILPGVSSEEVGAYGDEIRRLLEEYNATRTSSDEHISISVGYAGRENTVQTLDYLEKEALDVMRRRKLFERKSRNNAVLASIMSTLDARSQETEEHSRRLADISESIAGRMGLPSHQKDQLRLLSMIHDIGKIGINDAVLNKPGPLTDEEWEQMRQHPRIGYRIALSVPELAGVADYILTHHERWDGQGYPFRLAEEQIPIVSRILAVADAYDAMTMDRVYRKAGSHDDAVEEIQRCSGSQFDPQVVEVFAEIIEDFKQREKPDLS